MTKRRGKLALGTALAALLVAGPATLAEAAVKTVGGYKFVERTRGPMPPGTSKRARSLCPGDTHVLAGGYETTTGFPNQVLLSERPIADDGWMVRGSNQSASTPMDFTTEAVCSPEKPEYRTKKHTLDPSAQEHITPECKGGELATDMAFGGRNPVNSIFPLSNGGFTGYVDNLEAEEERIKSYLVCIEDRSVRRVTASEVVGTAFPVAHVKVRCPPNRFAVSGGQSNPASYNQIRQVGSSAARSGRAFTTTVHNNTAGPISITVYALCLKKAEGG